MTKNTRGTAGRYLNSPIDPELLKRLKVAAIMSGERMQDIVARAIERELTEVDVMSRNRGTDGDRP